MSYNVASTPYFDKHFKRLAKKYPSLKIELITLVNSLSANPIQGDYIGQSCYKIRLAISSKGKGKSGGARVITHFILSNDYIHLIGIYDKSELENINSKEILELVKKINAEET